jgi:hypothetical protein
LNRDSGLDISAREPKQSPKKEFYERCW